MALTILYGSSISVKTEKLYDRILREADLHPERSYVLLVPEQASLYVQGEMIRRAPRHALLNIDILTFNRLAYRVFNDFPGEKHTALDDIGKRMLLRIVLREQEKELRVLSRNLKKEGFLDELQSVFSELAEYNVSPERLKAGGAALSAYPGLQAKLSEIALVYGAFLERLHRSYEMAEERLTRLAERLPEWPAAGKTVFALTGFTGFTPPQEAVIRALMRRSPDILITADLGSGRKIEEQKHEDDLFHMSYVMCTRMKALASALQCPVYEETVTEEKPVSAAVRTIERGLFAWSREKAPAEDTGNLRIVKAAVPAEEVRLLFSEILSSLKEGCRLRDLAVVCGDPARYHDDILSCATELGLPVFFDATQAIDGNPLFLLVREILEVLSEDYSYESISALLKTPLFVRFLAQEIDPSDTRYSAYERICEFENFCLARGVRGRSRLEKPFTGRYRGFAEGRITAVNEVRSLAFAPVFALQEVLKKRGAGLGERIGALRDFLDAVRAEASMQALAQETKDRALRREYERSWEFLLDFLKKTEDILADEMLSFDAFKDVLISGVSGLRIGLVPPSRDELIVGDLMRTRLSDIRRLYVIGANEGLLPMQQESGGLLSDRDRELLKTAEIPLSPTAREEGFSAQFYLYRLLSRPSESVWISCAMSDTDGRALTPSYVIGRLQQLFPSLQPEEKALRGVKEAVGFGDAVLSAAELLRESVGSGKAERLTGEDLSLLSWLLDQEESGKALSSVLEAVCFRYAPEKLRPETAAKLFGSSVNESVSRLEAFANCPFAHFLQYGLLLRERPEYRVEMADMGTLLHNSINTFFGMLGEAGIGFSEVSEEQCAVFAEKAVAEVAINYEGGLLKDSARNRYLEIRVRRLIDRTVAVLKKQWEAGDYESTRTEVPFGAGCGIDAVRLPVEEGLSLSLAGRIDRMDIGQRSGRIYVKIIDYKSGKKDIDYTRIYYGLQLQLLLYMEAARAAAERKNPGSIVIPAGIYYYHVDDPMVDAVDEEEAEKKIAGELKLHGITNTAESAVSMIDREIAGYSSVVSGLQLKKDGSFSEKSRVVTQDEMTALGAFAVNKAKELGRAAGQGNIEVRPWQTGSGDSSCTYCSFMGICGYDRAVPGFRTLRLPNKELKDLIPANQEETA